MVRNRSSAQSLIETVVGIIFMIPIVLFLFDIGVMVLANTANDNLAKQAARAAAGATPPGNPPPQPIPANIPQYQTAAKQAADQVVANYANASKSAYMQNVTMAKMWYNGNAVAGVNAPPGNIDLNPGPGNVAVFTHMECSPPVPFPGFNTNREFFARAVEPIVSLPPPEPSP